MLEPAKLQMNWASASGINTLRNAAGDRVELAVSVTAGRSRRFRDR
jgi:hypothetical protein